MSVQVPGLETKNSALSILLSFLCPGLGHLYLGRVIRGVMMLAGTAILLYLILLVAVLANDAEHAHFEERLKAEVARPGYQNRLTLEVYNDAWKAANLPFHQWFLLYLPTIILSILLIVGWAWGMVDAQKLCEKHNREVYAKAVAATAGGPKS